MISGDKMKKQLIVKRKHRYQEERDILFQGIGDVLLTKDGIKLIYQEKNKEACVMVEVNADKNRLSIQRSGETKSVLPFALQQKTTGVLTTPYGEITIDLFTHRYICKHNIITLEYDIYNEEECVGGYRIIWSIKEA